MRQGNTAVGWQSCLHYLLAELILGRIHGDRQTFTEQEDNSWEEVKAEVSKELSFFLLGVVENYS
jgi:hypothetical protein